jgi:hypothetical protein
VAPHAAQPEAPSRAHIMSRRLRAFAFEACSSR